MKSTTRQKSKYQEFSVRNRDGGKEAPWPTRCWPTHRTEVLEELRGRFYVSFFLVLRVKISGTISTCYSEV